ncbi:hypothetical protein PY650_19290 [Rhizobium calliandrae]|uniref:Winged helix-turn-helix domain-containing protein n=1 Tax=Rhizobium calliandrae TaxID=1312182 RepID=A0ABT7KKK8_9HYPH|nr:hypothetical protein [Rhizobium calliandrae]MDL2407764.1 hypothetical protein [Rhizobium calliandrae]
MDIRLGEKSYEIGGESSISTAARERFLPIGSMKFLPESRLVIQGDVQRRISEDAAALLLAFVERPNQTMTEADLREIAWPSEPSTKIDFDAHIRMLEHLLSAGPHECYLRRIGAGGYQLSVQASIPVPREAQPNSHSDEEIRHGRLPAPLGRLFGRQTEIDEVAQLVENYRLTNIVGPGGIGKTALALEVASRLGSKLEQRIVFVDLASVSHGFLVPFAVAAAFEMSVKADDPVRSLVSFLRDRSSVVVLDNCEHVISTAAPLVEILLKEAPNLRILATSRETLCAEGEQIFRLAPLDIPNDENLSLDDAKLYPSIQLFVERAMSSDHRLSLDDSDVPFVVNICRKLDGIPLAIEIAATRMGVLGVVELSEQLDSCLDVPGRRTSVDRHQTIRKMLDWSHDNLTPAERIVFRRLSMFAGPFQLEAAATVGGDEYLSSSSISTAFAGLVRKSLLHPTVRAGVTTYRLLESSRVYALEKLEASGETPRMRRLHVEWAIETMRRAETDWTCTKRVIWVERYSPMLGDIRQALEWAFSPEGDIRAGVRLSALVMPLGLHMGLVDECRERTRVAIAYSQTLPHPDLDAQVKLHMFESFLNTNQVGPNQDTVTGAATAVRIADAIGHPVYRIAPRMLLAGCLMGMGNYREALQNAEAAGKLSTDSGDGLAILAAQRVLAQTTHFNGLLERSATLTKTVLASPVVNIPLAAGVIHVDKRVSMRIILSRTLWLQGMSEQAVAVMKEAVAIAPEDGPPALCQALSQSACVILLWCGYHDRVGEYIDRLFAATSRYTLTHWNSWATMYRRVLARIEAPDAGELAPIPTDGILQLHTLATITGQLDGIDTEGRSFFDETGWAGPEILRRSAIRKLLVKSSEGMQDLRRSIDAAKQQGALAWQLRAATSLARHLKNGGELRQAIDELSAVYERFEEGFESTDLKAAATLLSELAAA